MATSLEKFLIPWRSVELGKQIGQGSFGVVHAATVDGKSVAVKMLNLTLPPSILGTLNISCTPPTSDPNYLVDDFAKEMLVMGRLNHPNVMRMIGVCLPPDPLCIIFELLSKGCLDNILLNPQEVIDRDRRYRFCLDIAQGMQYLHGLGLIHSDLKPQNILVSEDDACKIGDFGLARVLQINATSITNKTSGTPSFTAPEVFKGERFNTKVDVYAFGVSLWTILSRVHPYSGWMIHALIYSVVSQGERPAIPGDCEHQYGELMSQCWQDKPKKRPNFDEIVASLISARDSVKIISFESAKMFKSSLDNPVQVSCWSVDEVCNWLVNCGFDDIAPVFRKQEIDGDVLLGLTEGNLKDDLEMVVFGRRKKLAEQIRSLKANASYAKTFMNRSVFEDSLVSLRSTSATSSDFASLETDTSVLSLPWPTHPVILETFVSIMETHRQASMLAAALRFTVYVDAVRTIQQAIAADKSNSETLRQFSASLNEHYARVKSSMPLCSNDAEKGELLRDMFQELLHLHGGVATDDSQ